VPEADYPTNRPATHGRDRPQARRLSVDRAPHAVVRQEDADRTEKEARALDENAEPKRLLDGPIQPAVYVGPPTSVAEP